MAIAKRRSKEKTTKEQIFPIRCKCGLDPIVVKSKHGKMVSCRDPMNCCGNYRTLWKRTEKEAIETWNSFIRYGGEIR